MTHPNQYYNGMYYKSLQSRATNLSFDDMRIRQLDFLFSTLGNGINSYKDLKQHITTYASDDSSPLTDNMFNKIVYVPRLEIRNTRPDCVPVISDTNPDKSLYFPVYPGQSKKSYYPISKNFPAWILSVSLKHTGPWFKELWVPEIAYYYKTRAQDITDNPDCFRSAFPVKDENTNSIRIRDLFAQLNLPTVSSSFIEHFLSYNTPCLYEYLSLKWEEEKKLYINETNRVLDFLSPYL